MSTLETDPWERWYGAYVANRAEVRAAKRAAQERGRAATALAGLLVAYMLLGGIAASVAVGLVMAN